MDFKALDNELPDLRVLTDRLERTIGISHVLVLENLKEIARQLTHQILAKEEQVGSADSDPLSSLEDLLQIEILPPHLEDALKQLEYIHPSESDLFLDESKVERFMLSTYDLMLWYIKTYVNEQFQPPPLLLKPRTTALHIASPNTSTDTEQSTNGGNTVLSMDGMPVTASWSEGTKNEVELELEASEAYIGQISQGMKSGKGTYRWFDGTKYEGHWFMDREHGYGIKHYANGDRYSGEWKQGLFCGKGTYEWQDGTQFEGLWQDSLEHGYGIKTYRDGRVQRGLWAAGELVYHEELFIEGDRSSME